MALPVKKFREIVFQFLYTHAFEEYEEREVIALIMRQNAIPRSGASKAAELANAVWEKKGELDNLIKEKASSYEMERIPKVEQTVLRLSLYELLYSELPPKVVISEGVRIAKKFATKEGATFVNALLDAIYQERRDAISEEQTAQ